MIVTFSGGLYIVFGLLAVFQLRGVHPTDEKIVGSVSIAFLLAVGVGLLMRRNWARWLALGPALLTWTLGGLVLLWQLILLLKAFVGSDGSASIWLVITLIICALFAAFIWINFKLFNRLTSAQGRSEFNTPESETHAVAKSAAVQIAWIVLSLFIVEPGVFGLGRSSNPDMAEVQWDAGRSQSERANDAQQRQRAVEHAAREQELVAQAVERARQASVDSERSRLERAEAERHVEAENPPTALQESETSTPDVSTAVPSQPDISSERPKSAILKCRDSSGAISFTQGYCPAGTTLVEAPPAD